MASHSFNQFQTSRPDNVQICSFFRKTGSCRYGLMCSRFHDCPNQYDGCTGLISNETLETPNDPSILVLRIQKMFVHYHLGILTKNGPEDQDSGLEFDEAQLISDYHQFYEEVRQELESRWGKIAVLRTCRNLSDHLKGTVYVEFARGPTATWEAAEACHGRWFGGNQLNCSVVRLAGGWREAICGLYHRDKCSKGDVNCNFLHVFFNPGESSADLTRALQMQLGQLPHHLRRGFSLPLTNSNNSNPNNVLSSQVDFDDNPQILKESQSVSTSVSHKEDNHLKKSNSPSKHRESNSKFKSKKHHYSRHGYEKRSSRDRSRSRSPGVFYPRLKHW